MKLFTIGSRRMFGISADWSRDGSGRAVLHAVIWYRRDRRTLGHLYPAITFPALSRATRANVRAYDERQANEARYSTND